MKKFILAAASLSVLGLASAHAQVFPSTTSDNSARITQTGNQNDARIDQAVNGIINGQGLAEIIQNGNRNEGVITQTSATSPMTSGFANEALIDQRRARGIATIDQIHDYARTRVNDALIVQITPDAVAHIDQRGDRLTATIRQFSTSSLPLASIKQNGTINTAIVRQRGADGFVDVRQGTYSSGPGASPDMSRGRVEVDNEGVNADIYVTQLGIGHNAFVFENGTNGLIDIAMDGQFNNATVNQASSNGVVRIYSTAGSRSNAVTVNQLAGDNGSTAFVSQSGAFGDARVEQRDNSSLGGNNLADVLQSGVGTSASSIFSDILQNGGNNRAFVNQASSYAQSAILQTGVGHMANVSQ